MKIVYKCENPDCTYPDHVEYNPTDDNITCQCGSVAMGHHRNVEDLVKKAKWEE